MRLLVLLSGERQNAGEKPIVVPGERPLRPRYGEDGDNCAIRRTSQQKRAAPSTVLASAHRIGALFDSSVVLLQSIVEIFARSMMHIAAHYLTNCSWIGTVPIGCHLIRHMPNDRHCLLEKSLSRLHVPLLASHGIYQIAILINCPIQIPPFPVHFERGLINGPGSPGLPSSRGFATDLLSLVQTASPSLG